MNPGLSEEIGKSAGTFMEIMRAQPIALSLVLMNIALLMLFWLILSRIDDHNKDREAKIFESHRHVSELLAQCVVPNKGK